MKKKKKVVFPPNPGVSQAKLTRGIPCLLQNACFILGNSLPFTLFILGSKKDRSSLLQLRYSFLPFFACKSDGIGDLEQSVSLERSGWGFTFSRLVREPPSRGRSLLSLSSWKPGEIMDTRSFCSLSLQCVLQISVTPEKKEIWVKEQGSSTCLETTQLIEKFNSGRDARRPKRKRNWACRCSEQENRRSYHPQVKKLCGAGKYVACSICHWNSQSRLLFILRLGELACWLKKEARFRKKC